MGNKQNQRDSRSRCHGEPSDSLCRFDDYSLPLNTIEMHLFVSFAPSFFSQPIPGLWQIVQSNLSTSVFRQGVGGGGGGGGWEREQQRQRDRERETEGEDSAGPCADNTTNHILRACSSKLDKHRRRVMARTRQKEGERETERERDRERETEGARLNLSALCLAYTDPLS